jgi:Nucleotidyl transferase AbiEii toxin, Type IV TA system
MLTEVQLSWGVNPTYAHEWNGSGESEIRIQISRRETPTLPPERRAQCEQSYFGLLPFRPAQITCLTLPEILYEKIRACYQRNKARDLYDLGIYATRPLDQALIRRLVVLKLWQAQDTFDPARLMEKFDHGMEFDWDDLRDLVRRDANINRDRICADCVRGFRFLSDLTPEEWTLAGDGHQRENALAERLQAETA